MTSSHAGVKVGWTSRYGVPADVISVPADSASVPATAMCVPAVHRTEKVEKPDETGTVTVFTTQRYATVILTITIMCPSVNLSVASRSQRVSLIVVPGCFFVCLFV